MNQIRTLLCRWGMHWACGGSSVHKCPCGSGGFHQYRRWCECGCHPPIEQKEPYQVPIKLLGPEWRP
jgi:hypothetical protein